MKETDVQEYLNKNLEKLPKFLEISKLQKKFTPIRKDLVFNPLKYLLYKKYTHILEKMEYNFEKDSLEKFGKEFNTAEWYRSKPRIDILAFKNDPSTFFIIEVKFSKQTERQTITELLQYANGLQTNDFPGLSNDNIVLVVVAKDWNTILTQSVINGILFKDLNLLPIQVNGNKVSEISFKFYDLWEKEVIQNLSKQIYDEASYSTRMVAFDEFKKGLEGSLKVEYEDIKKITIQTAMDFSKQGRTGYILGIEKEIDSMYKNSIAILQFDPFILKNKNWELFTEKKTDFLVDFSQNNDYLIDTSDLKENIKFHYPKNKIDFEEGNNQNGFSGIISKYLFSYGYPTGFLLTLIKDLIKFCREDKEWDCSVIGSDDIYGNEELSHYVYLERLFYINSSGAKNIQEFINWRIIGKLSEK